MQYTRREMARQTLDLQKKIIMDDDDSIPLLDAIVE